MSTEKLPEKDLKLERLKSLIEARRLIPTAHLEVEAELMIRKWPAYRFMPPRKATALFAIEYEKAYRDSVKINLDLYLADRVRPIGKLDRSAPNFHYTQMWVARQHADELGVLYSEYLRFCFKFAMNRQRERLPRPNQLRPNINTEIAWQAEFNKFWTDEVRQISMGMMDRIGPMAQYTSDNFRKLPAQAAFKEQLFRDAQGLNKRSVVRDNLVFQRLSKEDCGFLLEPEELSRTLTDFENDLKSGVESKVQYSPLGEPEFWQACFGLIPSTIPDGAVCGVCPQATSCAKMQSIVSRGLENQTGSIDPLGDHRKSKQREHTARSRAKAKARKAALV